MSLVFSAEGLPALHRAIAHWHREIRDTRAQIASGRFPDHDANCRRYIGECTGRIRRLNGQVHRLRSARPSSSTAATAHRAPPAIAGRRGRADHGGTP